MRHVLPTFGRILSTVMFLTAGIFANSAMGAPTVETMRLPDGGINAQTAVDGMGRVHLIYFKGDPKHGDEFYARSDDGGRTFAEARRVNSQPGSVVIIGTIRGPQIAIGKANRIHIAWMGSDKAEPKLEGKAAPMLYTRLNDAGDGFERQKNVIQIHPGLDGGGSVAADDEGNVYVAWHAPEKEGGTEADRRVWITRSSDEGKTFAAETAATDDNVGACGCCGMRIAASGGGRVAVLFRSATDVFHRDMTLLQSGDHGKTFNVVCKDPWEVGTCVMSTSSLMMTKDGAVAVWETRGQIYVVNWDGKSKPAPIPVSGTRRGRKHPALAINARGELSIAWTEGTGWNNGGSVAWQVFDASGESVDGRAGNSAGLPAWGVPAVIVDQAGNFRIIF